jgi:micrococcal nuclease
MRLAAAFATLIYVSAPAAAMDFCAGKVRVTCVVDGDTFWLKGEKIRLADVDAPESGGGCLEERRTAAEAAGRLAELLDEGAFEVVRTGRDIYGRTLAVVTIDGDSVGSILVQEHMARPWQGHKENWCEPPSQ